MECSGTWRPKFCALQRLLEARDDAMFDWGTDRYSHDVGVSLVRYSY